MSGDSKTRLRAQQRRLNWALAVGLILFAWICLRCYVEAQRWTAEYLATTTSAQLINMAAQPLVGVVLGLAFVTLSWGIYRRE